MNGELSRKPNGELNGELDGEVRGETDRERSGEFILGCNYWASNAGADMWRLWDEDAVERDLEILSRYGIRYLRVFLNWRDFQPVMPLYGQGGRQRGICMEDGTRPSNIWYLDETMLERFRRFCGMARRRGLKLIVGLLTGWMSGRLYIPTLLNGKNLFSDPTALKLEQLLVEGTVRAFKGEDAVYAWDLGNECNCMGEAAEADEAYSWTRVITNAIRAQDRKRPVVSGMHSLEIGGIWNLQDQGEITDVLTTHPYPFWVPHCNVEPISSFRTLLHATAQTEYYRSVGRKPCLVEEIGTMGPMICDDETAAGFLRVNLFSNWLHGASGLMWWCANEQSHLTEPPYEWNMCERELGMLTRGMDPKPVLREMENFARFLEQRKGRLPEKTVDAVCVLTRGQDHWGIAYMTYLLAKQAGATIDFAFCGQELPDRPAYLLPSLRLDCMFKSEYERLKEKVRAGATLYLSMENAFLTEFEELTGLRVEYSSRGRERGSFLLEDGEAEEITYERDYTYRLHPTRAEILARDEGGAPLFARSAFGKGRVYVLNFPAEAMLLEKENGLKQGWDRIYRQVFRETLNCRPVTVEGESLGITYHPEAGGAQYAAVVNYSDIRRPLRMKLKEGWEITDTLLGDTEEIEAYGTAIFRLECKEG